MEEYVQDLLEIQADLMQLQIWEPTQTKDNGLEMPLLDILLLKEDLSHKMLET